MGPLLYEFLELTQVKTQLDEPIEHRLKDVAM